MGGCFIEGLMYCGLDICFFFTYKLNWVGHIKTSPSLTCSTSFLECKPPQFFGLTTNKNKKKKFEPHHKKC